MSSFYSYWMYERVKENVFKSLSTNSTKWPNTLKQSVFDHFVGLALKGLRLTYRFDIKLLGTFQNIYINISDYLFNL